MYNLQPYIFLRALLSGRGGFPSGGVPLVCKLQAATGRLELQRGNRLFARLAHGVANGLAFEAAFRRSLGHGGGFYGQSGMQGTAQALALWVGRFFKT